jgi:hypothetical protein
MTRPACRSSTPKVWLSRSAASCLSLTAVSLPVGAGISATGLTPPAVFGAADVVALVVRTREIAAELLLSEKTVESHMTRLFGKLGVRSRAEVAEAVGRERGDV